MNKKFILGGLAGGVFAFFFGWLIFGILLMSTMENLSTDSMKGVMLAEEDMNFLSMIVSNLGWGYLTSFVIVNLAKVNTWSAGAKYGAIISLLMAIAYDAGFYGMTTLFSLQSMLFDIATSTFMGFAVGAVVGWVVGKIKD